MTIELRAQYADQFLASALPALRALTNKDFKAFPAQYKRFFRMMESTQSIEQDTGVGQFGLFQQRPEAANAIYDSLAPSFPKTYVHLTYNLGYVLSHELVADDKFGLATANASALGRSAAITPEIFAASVFLNGFNSSFPGPDGVQLFSTAHPKESGGTQSNVASPGVDLSVPAIEAGLTAMRGLTDDRGKLMYLPPQKLIVPPALEFRAAEFLGGDMRADTANHTINAFRQRAGMGSFREWEAWDYLGPNSSPGGFSRAWYLQSQTSYIGLKFFWREVFNQISKLEFENRSAKTAGWMRFSFGWSFWQGNYGSPGGGSSSGS